MLNISNIFVEKLVSGTLLVTIMPTPEEEAKGDVRIEEFFIGQQQAGHLARLLLTVLGEQQ